MVSVVNSSDDFPYVQASQVVVSWVVFIFKWQMLSFFDRLMMGRVQMWLFVLSHLTIAIPCGKSMKTYLMTSYLKVCITLQAIKHTIYTLLLGCWESSGPLDCQTSQCISSNKASTLIHKSHFCCCQGSRCNFEISVSNSTKSYEDYLPDLPVITGNNIAKLFRIVESYHYPCSFKWGPL